MVAGLSRGRAFILRVIKGTDIIYASGHTKWIDGETDVENHRINLDAGKTLEVTKVELRQQTGGTSDANAYVEVVDEDASTVLASTDLNTQTTSGGTSSDGAAISVRLTNNTGSAVNMSTTIWGLVA